MAGALLVYMLPLGHAQTLDPQVSTSAKAAVQQGITLPLHAQELLPVSGRATRVAVGDPQVADVQILSGNGGRSGEVMLFANQPGSTDVQVWTQADAAPQRWRITVLGDDRAAATAAGVPGSMVQVEVKVVELSHNVLKEIGVQWGAAGSGRFRGGVNLMPSSLLPLGSNGFAVGYASRNFAAALALIESNGMGRVLAEPTLVAMSGQSASFLAGGEIPVPQPGGLGTTTVEYKPFGIGLTVAPTVLSRQRIALKVAPEASELDYANAISIGSGAQAMLMPALRTRRADTMIELGDGESFVISGLVSRQTIANVKKMPFLGELPVIGAFFRNMQYSQEERELIIVVTPRLVRSLRPGTALPLPGDDREHDDTLTNAWGHYLVGPASGQHMPGFSR